MVDEYTRHLERNKEVKGKGLSQFRMKVLADVLLFFSPFSVAVLPHTGMVDEYTRHLERNKEVKGKGLSQFRMKVLADVLLFFSPFSVAVLPHIVGKPSRENMFALSVCVIGEAISWASIPIFAWLLYQGFEWTGNAWLYGLRLLVLALVCEVPYDYVMFGSAFDMRSQNPVFGLVVALIVSASWSR